MKKIIVVIFIAVITPKIVLSEVNGSFFLREEISSRALAMGSAFTSLADDSDSIFINPAGLGLMINPEIAVMYKKGVMDSYFGFLGYACPFENVGIIEAGIFYFNGGEIELNYLDGSSEIVVSEQDFVISLSYGNSFAENFYYGSNIKYIRSTLAAKYSADAYAFDFGVIYRMMENKLSFGASVLNIGTKIAYITVGDPLPLTFRFGAGFQVRESNIDSWLISADAVYSDSTFRYNTGIECFLFEIVALRGGYKINYDPSEFTLGMGFRIYRTELDYAYIFKNNFDPNHVISFKFIF